jgi:hypothetical protein
MAEFYEIRIYRVFDFEKQNRLEAWMKNALLPALGRLGIKNVGVFRNLGDPNDHSQFMVIPFQSMEEFATLNLNLAKDKAFTDASKEWFDQDMKDPVYNRIDSWITQAFDSIPKMEIPAFAKAAERIYELRLYESHNMDSARRKVKMFDDGETQLMRDVKLGPVFFGRTLAGPDSPNLIYLLGAESEVAHKAHWKAFLSAPKWAAIKDLPEYANTVSKIQSWKLKPTEFSQL